LTINVEYIIPFYSRIFTNRCDLQLSNCFILYYFILSESFWLFYFYFIRIIL